MANVDPQRLRQALDNLIENAVAHSPSGGQVSVDLRRVDRSAAIAVTDKGEGIAPADHEAVFLPGVRRTTARPGSGIGLAVVRDVAVAHGGAVELESALGQGSRFRLVLPLAGRGPSAS